MKDLNGNAAQGANLNTKMTKTYMEINQGQIEILRKTSKYDKPITK